MSEFYVADVGNSRLKWGRCDEQKLRASVALPLDDSAAWKQQLEEWGVNAPASWTLAGGNPPVLQRLKDWLKQLEMRTQCVERHEQLPLKLGVDRPEQVGLDRLLDAVAFNARAKGKTAGVIADAGSAVTVDFVDRAGVFRGGAIFPGLRLMAEALHTYTAKLPLVQLREKPPTMPGTRTEQAIAIGVHGAVVGGIKALADELARSAAGSVECWLTGGDAALLAPGLGWNRWPHMTLEGLRLVALHLQ